MLIATEKSNLNIDLNLDLRQGSVVTVGNFDGAHLGHRRIIERLIETGRRMNLPSVCVTFNPHPRHYFNPAGPPDDLTPIIRKAELLSDFPLSLTLVLPFNKALAEESAAGFIRRILVGRLKARQLVVGYDCCFGRDRAGNVALLRHEASTLPLAQAYGVEEVPALNAGGLPVSSSRIRALLAAGTPEAIPDLLGRYYSLDGVVVEGKKRGGALLGFPTANLVQSGYLLPPKGVYVTLTEYEGSLYHSVTNIGLNPSFGDTGLTVETYLMGFCGDLYGRTLRVSFVQKLRDEKKFTSLDDLKASIRSDVEQAGNVFAALNI